MSPALAFALAAVRWWTVSYTLGLPADVRYPRRDEIESDLWEFHEDARRSGASPEGIAVHMLARLFLGIPDDLAWRVEQVGPDVHQVWQSIGLALAAGILMAGLWVISLLELQKLSLPLNVVHFSRASRPLQIPPAPRAAPRK